MDLKISDTLSQTRGVNEFKKLDQESNALAERVGGLNANRELENKRAELPDSQALTDNLPQRTVMQVIPRSTAPQKSTAKGTSKNSPPPEERRGHVLDLKA